MAASNGIMAALREHTRPEHEVLETMLPLGSSTLRITQLADCLRRFYGFYVPWEDRASAMFSGPDLSFFRSRTKLPLLAADLAYLGVDPLDVPRCEGLPAMNTLPRALGSMYVLEGATLGGQIISRNIEATLPLRWGDGYSFFRSYGEQTGSMWRAFGARLQQESTPENDPEILGSARHTFRSLIDWFGSPQ